MISTAVSTSGFGWFRHGTYMHRPCRPHEPTWHVDQSAVVLSWVMASSNQMFVHGRIGGHQRWHSGAVSHSLPIIPITLRPSLMTLFRASASDPIRSLAWTLTISCHMLL